MIRVREYNASAYYVSTGSASSGTHKFTEEHAKEAGAIAEWLCEKWTRRGQHQSIRYRYWIDHFLVLYQGKYGNKEK